MSTFSMIEPVERVGDRKGSCFRCWYQFQPDDAALLCHITDSPFLPPDVKAFVLMRCPDDAICEERLVEVHRHRHVRLWDTEDARRDAGFLSYLATSTLHVDSPPFTSFIA